MISLLEEVKQNIPDCQEIKIAMSKVYLALSHFTAEMGKYCYENYEK